MNETRSTTEDNLNSETEVILLESRINDYEWQVTREELRQAGSKRNLFVLWIASIIASTVAVCWVSVSFVSNIALMIFIAITGSIMSLAMITAVFSSLEEHGLPYFNAQSEIRRKRAIEKMNEAKRKLDKINHSQSKGDK